MIKPRRNERKMSCIGVACEIRIHFVFQLDNMNCSCVTSPSLMTSDNFKLLHALENPEQVINNRNYGLPIIQLQLIHNSIYMNRVIQWEYPCGPCALSQMHLCCLWALRFSINRMTSTIILSFTSANAP